MRFSLLATVACSFSLVVHGTAALPYVTEPAFGDLKIQQPVAIVAPPGETNRLFFVEKPGRIVVISDLAYPIRTVFLDLTDRVGDDSGEQALLALVFHPDFKRNRQFYVWYTSCLKVRGTTVREDRLSRFLVSLDDPNVADSGSEQRMISQVDEASNHNGGELLFGSDGYLYLSLGDEGGGRDSFKNSQRINRDYFAGILRLDVDQRPENLKPNPHPAVHPGTYAVPRDNPFVGATMFNRQPVDPKTVRTEFWAVGLRNPWRMAFDSVTDQLWCGDVGQNDREEINVIVRGGNYGWDHREGFIAGSRSNAPQGTALVDPVWDYPRNQGVSITGGLVYRGSRWPDLVGKYLFADFASGRIWALDPEGDKPVDHSRVQQIAEGHAIASFGHDPRNGDVLLANLGGNTILRLVRRRTNAK